MASAPSKSSTMWLACIRSLLLLLLLFVPRLIYAASNHVKVWTARTRCDSCEITETSQTLHQCLFMRWRAPPSWERTIKTDCLPSVWPFVRLSAINNSACHPSSTRLAPAIFRHAACPLTDDVGEDKKSENEDPIALCVVIGATWWAPIGGFDVRVSPRSWATQTDSWRRRTAPASACLKSRTAPVARHWPQGPSTVLLVCVLKVENLQVAGTNEKL